MPSYDAVRPSRTPGYLRNINSHAEGFFSEEERLRRKAVLERITDVEREQQGQQNGMEKDYNINTDLSSAKSGGRRPSSIEYARSIPSPTMKENSDTQWINDAHKQISSPINGLTANVGTKYPDHIHSSKELEPSLGGTFDNFYDTQELKQVTQDLMSDRELRDRIATRAFYTTTTQKLYQEGDLVDSVKRKPDPRLTVIEPRPDMVSQRIRRYEAKPEIWQKFSIKPFTWDYVKGRNGHYVNRPFAFSSESKKVGQIPNYTGHVSGEGEKDVYGETFTPLTNLRLSKPRYTMTSKRGYIPGYEGCVLWRNTTPPLSAEREPRQESTARAHKPLQRAECTSPFNHEGPLSRMVTLTHPFNPFNTTQPHQGSTASGNRV